VSSTNKKVFLTFYILSYFIFYIL